MSETPGSTAPSGSTAPRRLTRSPSDRMVAGVCGGLAAYTGLDPVIFRVVFAVTTIVGGAGLAAYLVAWLVIPEETGEPSHIQRVLGDRDLPRGLLIGLGVVLVLVLSHAVVWPLGRRFGDGGFGLVVLSALGIWLWVRHGDAATRPPTSATAAPPSVAAEVVDAPQPQPRPSRRTRRRPRERSRLVPITLSALLLTAGVLTAVHTAGWAAIGATTALAIFLIVVGAGLLVGTWYGHGRGLIFLGLVLTMATAGFSVADVPFNGGTGQRAWSPQSSASLESAYRLGAGHIELDLRQLDLGGDTRRVEVTLGTGHLQLWLPDRPSVHIDAHLGAGKLSLLDQVDGGIDVSRHTDLHGSGSGHLTLDIRVGVGRVEVQR